MVRRLWYHQVNAIVYVKLGDAAADSYKCEPMAVLLDRWETIRRFYLSRRNAREGSPGCTLVIESRHGSEKCQTPFASTGVVKRSNRNRGREVLLTNDPQKSTPQAPVGNGSELGSGIGNQVGRLNCPPD